METTMLYCSLGFRVGVIVEKTMERQWKVDLVFFVLGLGFRVYGWGYLAITEKKLETTMLYYSSGFRVGVIWGQWKMGTTILYHTLGLRV